MPNRIRSVEVFYAHALAIEHEAAQRYSEFESWFRDRGEEVLAGLCGNLARLEGEHFNELLDASRHLLLPAIERDGYAWIGEASPEAPAREFFYRVAHPHHLLQVALQAEMSAAAFFEHIAFASDSPEVCALARQMAAEEREHVTWVRNALEYHPLDAGQKSLAPSP